MVTDLYNVGQVDHDQWSVRSRSGRSWVTDLYDVGQVDHDQWSVRSRLGRS